MTCAFCNYEFCYFCGADSSSGANHWAPGMGCGATMMGEGTVRSPCCNLLKRLCMILAMIVAYPFIAVLAPPLLLTIGWIGSGFMANPCCGCVCLLFCPIMFAIGLCLDILWTPFALIAMPTMFIVMMTEQCFNRMKSKRQAMRKIKDIIENNKKLMSDNR